MGTRHKEITTIRWLAKARKQCIKKEKSKPAQLAPINPGIHQKSLQERVILI